MWSTDDTLDRERAGHPPVHSMRGERREMTQRNQLIIWGVAAGLAASVLLPWLNHIGRLELGVPIGAGAGTIGALIKVNWELRRRVWFWVTMAIITGLHVLLILYVPWHQGWVPAPLTFGIAIVDLVIMLGILNLIGRRFKSGTKTSA